MPELPPKLYRYRSLKTPEEKDWVRQTVVDSVVYVAASADYNDPFEFKYDIDFDSSYEIRVQCFTEWNIDQHGMSESHAEANAREAAAPAPLEEEHVFLKRMEETLGPWLIEQHRESVGVLSLSELYDQPLMWAHYADGHKGICLEFDTSAQQGRNKLFELAVSVTYQREFPVVRWFHLDEEERAHLITARKSSDWEYEREWRLLLADSARTQVPLPTGALTGVLLGALTSPSDEQEIKDWIEQSDSPIALRKMQFEKHRYGLRSQDLLSGG